MIVVMEMTIIAIVITVTIISSIRTNASSTYGGKRMGGKRRTNAG